MSALKSPVDLDQHRRYSISLIVLISTTIFILLHVDLPAAPHHFLGQYPFSSHIESVHPSLGYVEGEIVMSELYYQESLEERQRLINKWRSIVGEVESFPSHGESYTLWNFFPPAFQCPHRMSHIGALGDGGKWVCGMERIEKKTDCVIYSVGLKGESSFESSVLERAPGCQVYGYDFSVASFGPEIDQAPALKNRSHFYPYALGGIDAHGPTDDPPYYTLPILMAQNNHTFVDILKIDIGGAEFDALDALIDAYPSASSSPWFSDINRGGGRAASGLPFGQLLLEIHVRDNEPWDDFPRFLLWWEKLEQAGLRPFRSEANLAYIKWSRGARPDVIAYSFINIRGSHELVSDRYMGRC